MVKRKINGAVDGSSVDRKIRKSDAIVRNLWKIWRPAPSGTQSYGRLADKIWARFEILNTQFSASLSQGTALFQQLWCIYNAFSRQTFLPGCFEDCEISWSLMISHLSLLLIATKMNDIRFTVLLEVSWGEHFSVSNSNEIKRRLLCIGASLLHSCSDVR